MSPPKLQEPPVKKNAFVHKLYAMLSNKKLAHLIWWTGDDSNTFALYPSKEFADALLEYFKHGNVASFVRQLHMYGFHKVLDPASLAYDKDLPIWEFRHSLGLFKKNDESSLMYIKRRSLSNNLRHSSLMDHDQPIQPQHHIVDLHYPYSYPYAYYAPSVISQHPHHPPPHAWSYPPPVVAHRNPVNQVVLQPSPASPNIHSPQRHDHRLPHPINHPHPPSQPQSLPTYALAASAPYYYPPAQEESHVPQFRKPWDAALARKPRNPSFLFDPLAPLPRASTPQNGKEPVRLPPLVMPQPESEPPHDAPPQQKQASAIPVRKSIYDKFRPSLIELHNTYSSQPLVTLASSASSASSEKMLMGGNFDLIGSQASSVFSANGSVSLTSSARTLSFGSISHLVDGSSRLSVGPHEKVAPSPLLRPMSSTVSTIMEEREAGDSTPQTKLPLPMSFKLPALPKRPSESSLPGASKQSSPLFKAKVLYLLDSDDRGSKRQRVNE